MSSSSSDSVFKPEIINYKTFATHNGRYRLRRVLPSNVVNQTITLAETATQLLELKFPARTPFNTSRTNIDYLLEIGAPTNPAHFNWIHDHTVAEIDSIQYGNTSGVQLVDLQYAAQYLAVARKVDTDQLTFQTNDATSALYKDNTDLDNFYPPSVTPGTPNAFGVSGARRVDCVTNHEPVYVRRGNAAGAAMVVARSIPLSAFTHTALAMDRDVMFGEDLTLRIRIAGHEKVAYTSDKGDDASAGIAGSVNIVAKVSSVKMTNITMRLAVQVDPMVEAHVRTKFENGHMSYIFPFQYAWKVGTGLGHVAFQHSLTNQYGKKLKRVLTTAFNTAEHYSTAFDNCNMNAEKLDLYQTAMDSQPLQDDKISCKQPSIVDGPGMDDWRENRHLLKNSVIDNSMTYYLNWVHIDSFSNPKREASVIVPESNLLEGLDLDMPRTWSFSATGKSALSFFTFAEFIREVHASPLGPTEIRVA